MQQTFSLPNAIEVLGRTPRVLRTLLTGLGPHWTHTDYGPDTFTPFDVIGHLIHGEQADWLVRTRIILEQGVARPFDRYDRYAMFEDSRGKTLGQLLDEFERLRAANLSALRDLRLTPEMLGRRGMHPVLGEVTLEQLLATWVAHDLNHIAQIAKCMATQYEEAVGPWKVFLGIFTSPVTKMDETGANRARQSRADTRETRVGA